MEGFPLGAPANAALYGTRRTSRYLSLEARVAEAVSSAHGEVPDAKPRQTEVRGQEQSLTYTQTSVSCGPSTVALHPASAW